MNWGAVANVVVPPSALLGIGPAGQKLKDAAGNLPIVGPILKGPGHVDTAAAQAEAERTRQLAQALADERAGSALGTQDAARANAFRTRQAATMDALQAAAEGRTPSAAELQLQRQSAIDAARMYGLARSLRGSSPGAALTAAREGAASVEANTQQTAAAQRANEQAAARGELVTAEGQARGQDISQEQAEDAWRKALLDASLTASGQSVQTTLGQTQANIANAEQQTQAYGAGLGAVGAAGSAALGKPPTASDKRAKVVSGTRQLADKLGREVKGVTFTYRPGVEDGGKHFGVIAQELERVIPGVVTPDDAGIKRVETDQLTLANTALISELARRLRAVEGHRA